MGEKFNDVQEDTTESMVKQIIIDLIKVVPFKNVPLTESWQKERHEKNQNSNNNIKYGHNL